MPNLQTNVAGDAGSMQRNGSQSLALWPFATAGAVFLPGDLMLEWLDQIGDVVRAQPALVLAGAFGIVCAIVIGAAIFERRRKRRAAERNRRDTDAWRQRNG